ncbi:hypothetical protein BC628DRAFT_383616 [Trametes gibbosa]|nr:hypothetical protein BC628DRAFT_383616 [Trametes gibbosa]
MCAFVPLFVSSIPVSMTSVLSLHGGYAGEDGFELPPIYIYPLQAVEVAQAAVLEVPRAARRPRHTQQSASRAGYVPLRPGPRQEHEPRRGGSRVIRQLRRRRTRAKATERGPPRTQAGAAHRWGRSHSHRARKDIGKENIAARLHLCKRPHLVHEHAATVTFAIPF